MHEALGPPEERAGYVRPAILSTARRQQGGAADFGDATNGMGEAKPLQAATAS